MINYELPTSIIIDDVEYPINQNGDYRMILDVISALNDAELSEEEKAIISLNIFYDFNVPQDAKKAISEMMLFINCGDDEKKEAKKPIMSWEKDFSVLVSPINKVLGYEVRQNTYTHWWTFIAAYMEIDEECQFSHIVNIRSKKQKGKPLDKSEQEYYNANRDKIDLPIKYTNEEKEMLKNIFGETI